MTLSSDINQGRSNLFVTYYGKAHAEIDTDCFKQIPKFAKYKIIMIGDNLSTDIYGTNQLKLPTLWVNRLNQTLQRHAPQLPYIMQSLKKLSC